MKMIPSLRLSTSHGLQPWAILAGGGGGGGGGEGGLLAAIFESTENTRGILFDLPHVVATARMKFAGTPQAERPAFGEGDFFEGVPAGADAYVLKKVIHNWDDE